MTTPYVPQVPLQQPRHLYNSTVQVLRLQAQLTSGSAEVAWAPITDIIDPYLGKPGIMACRLDLLFQRPGKDQQMPLVAGRAPDRVGVLFYGPVTDASGVPLVKSGDRVATLTGPIQGTFEIRLIPDVAQSYLGAHHIEVQVIEVSQALAPGSVTPFPGSPA